MYEKIFDVTAHQENANQTYSGAPFVIGRLLKKKQKVTNVGEDMEEIDRV